MYGGGGLLYPDIKPNYLSNCSTDWGMRLACPTMAVADCTRIWFRVKRATSPAMSASRMADSAAVRFSTVTDRLEIARVSRFCTAPIFPRPEVMTDKAELMVLNAVKAASEDVTLKVEIPSADEVIAVKFAWVFRLIRLLDELSSPIWIRR